MAITIPILTDFNGSGIDKAVRQFGQLETTGQKAGFLIRKAALPAAAAIGALAAGAVVAAKAAAEDAAASDKLANQLDRVTTANDAALASVEPMITALSQQVGVADDELRPALGKLATSTGDLGKAQALLSTALDVSAQTGKPLEAVTTGLAKAYGGNLTALKKLIPGFDEGIIKSGNFARAQEELARLTGGAAAESANTAAGQFKRLSITFDETKEAVGAALLPVVQAFLPILQRMAQFAQENSTIIVVLAAGVAVLAGAILAVNAVMAVAAAATAVWTAAQWLLNAALAANPIVLVVAAIAAIVAAFVIAYEKSETFRKAIDALWEAFKSAFGWIRDTVGGIIEKVWDALKSFFGWIKEKAGAALGVLKSAFTVAFAPIYAAISAVRTVLRLLSAVKSAVEGTGGNIFGPGGTVGPVGTGGVTITGPQGATGGIVNRPTFALIGEAGPEAVVPLNRTRGNGPLPAGLGGSIVINIEAGLVSTPEMVGQQIIEAIQMAQRRSGPVFAAA